MWQQLKRLLLPYEFEDHPLYSAKYEEPEIDEELGEALDSLGPYPHPRDHGYRLLKGTKMHWKSPQWQADHPHEKYEEPFT